MNQTLPLARLSTLAAGAACRRLLAETRAFVNLTARCRKLRAEGRTPLTLEGARDTAKETLEGLLRDWEERKP